MCGTGWKPIKLPGQMHQNNQKEPFSRRQLGVPACQREAAVWALSFWGPCKWCGTEWNASSVVGNTPVMVVNHSTVLKFSCCILKGEEHTPWLCAPSLPGTPVLPGALQMGLCRACPHQHLPPSLGSTGAFAPPQPFSPRNMGLKCSPGAHITTFVTSSIFNNSYEYWNTNWAIQGYIQDNKNN